MTTLAPEFRSSRRRRSSPAPAPRFFVVENIRWETYERLLRDLDGQNVRITYDGGRMMLMSPLPWHEKVKKLIGRMIELASLELMIPVSSLGSTTWKRRGLKKGSGRRKVGYSQ